MRDLKLKNIPASIRQKLLNLARERNDDFGLILTKYGLERILFRLSKSKYRELFIRKVALLFELWTTQRYRPTRDADFLEQIELLRSSDPSDPFGQGFQLSGSVFHLVGLDV